MVESRAKHLEDAQKALGLCNLALSLVKTEDPTAKQMITHIRSLVNEIGDRLDLLQLTIDDSAQ